MKNTRALFEGLGYRRWQRLPLSTRNWKSSRSAGWQGWALADSSYLPWVSRNTFLIQTCKGKTLRIRKRWHFRVKIASSCRKISCHLAKGISRNGEVNPTPNAPRWLLLLARARLVPTSLLQAHYHQSLTFFPINAASCAPGRGNPICLKQGSRPQNLFAALLDSIRAPRSCRGSPGILLKPQISWTSFTCLINLLGFSFTSIFLVQHTA